MVGIAALLPRMFQNTLNIITQRNRKYKLAQTAAKMIKAYWIKLRKTNKHGNLQNLQSLDQISLGKYFIKDFLRYIL